MADEERGSRALASMAEKGPCNFFDLRKQERKSKEKWQRRRQGGSGLQRLGASDRREQIAKGPGCEVGTDVSRPGGHVRGCGELLQAAAVVLLMDARRSMGGRSREASKAFQCALSSLDALSGRLRRTN